MEIVLIGLWDLPLPEGIHRLVEEGALPGVDLRIDVAAELMSPRV
jgi:hypothetical protein